MPNEQINKKDFEIILQVNKKAVELETAVAEQNEDIINLLSDCKKQQEDIIEKQDEILEKQDKIISQNEEILKDIFKLQILFATGLISLIVQVISIFVKR